MTIMDLDRFVLLGFLARLVNMEIVSRDELSSQDIVEMSMIAPLSEVWDRFCNIVYRYRDEIGKCALVTIEIGDLDFLVARFKKRYLLRFKPIDFMEEIEVEER